MFYMKTIKLLFHKDIKRVKVYQNFYAILFAEFSLRENTMPKEWQKRVIIRTNGFSPLLSIVRQYTLYSKMIH